ncbi:uncharacterized protein LOC134948014 [Pseudophryne corroboree]|uniref:uncharacterized protein LOC134948014 n=1 Tax=Pseudophryne corroboree TaxID=495146 RepID=UPI003081FFBC
MWKYCSAKKPAAKKPAARRQQPRRSIFFLHVWTGFAFRRMSREKRQRPNPSPVSSNPGSDEEWQPEPRQTSGSMHHQQTQGNNEDTDTSEAELLGHRSAKTHPSEKMKIWRKIADNVTAVSGVVREVDVCKKRYSNCRRCTKKKMAKEHNYKKGTGGGPPLDITWLPWEEKIMHRMNPAMIQGLPASIDSSISRPAISTGNNSNQTTNFYCLSFNIFLGHYYQKNTDIRESMERHQGPSTSGTAHRHSRPSVSSQAQSGIHEKTYMESQQGRPSKKIRTAEVEKRAKSHHPKQTRMASMVSRIHSEEDPIETHRPRQVQVSGSGSRQATASKSSKSQGESQLLSKLAEKMASAAGTSTKKTSKSQGRLTMSQLTSEDVRRNEKAVKNIQADQTPVNLIRKKISEKLTPSHILESSSAAILAKTQDPQPTAEDLISTSPSSPINEPFQEPEQESTRLSDVHTNTSEELIDSATSITAAFSHEEDVEPLDVSDRTQVSSPIESQFQVLEDIRTGLSTGTTERVNDIARQMENRQETFRVTVDHRLLKMDETLGRFSEYLRDVTTSTSAVLQGIESKIGTMIIALNKLVDNTSCQGNSLQIMQTSHSQTAANTSLIATQLQTMNTIMLKMLAALSQGQHHPAIQESSQTFPGFGQEGQLHGLDSGDVHPQMPTCPSPAPPDSATTPGPYTQQQNPDESNC